MRRAILVHPDIRSGPLRTLRDPQARLDEAAGLCAAIGLTVTRGEIAPLAALRPATLFGSGKVAEIAAWAHDIEPDVIVVDGTLSPVQQRNLEKAWGAKVIDRTGLILEIFGERAQTKEGRLQVELAHLTYQRSRLVRSWTHLERQRGGFGFLGGPGETQIETDRRLIGERIAKIRRELEDVVRTRGLHRRARARVPYPVVALVGYTNAGKSSLFNALTRASVFAQDLLFATLDPTMRRLRLPSGRDIILSDTVGFISDLPTTLVAAFRATLEEVLEADLILHVRDIAHPDTAAQAEDVHAVLEEIGVGPERQDAMIELRNKIDLLDAGRRAALLSQNARETAPGGGHVFVSAVTGEGLEALLASIDRRLGAAARRVAVTVPAGEGALLAWVYAHGRVLARHDREDGAVDLSVSIEPAAIGPFTQRFPELAVPPPAGSVRISAAQ